MTEKITIHGLDNPAFLNSTGDLEKQPNEKKPSLKEDEEGGGSAQWGGKLEFLMSCVMMSVGLGNIWRFPFVARNNGGGAFLIPYIIVLLLIGRPMYYLEMALGQFTKRSPTRMFYKLSPVLRGIGIGQVIGTAAVASYYCSLMAITLIYFVNSFTNDFPWSTCWSSWDAYLSRKNLACVDRDTPGPFPNNTISSAELYFRKEVLKQKDDISDGIGYPDWKLTITLLLSWITAWLVSIKGVKSSGKAAYFLAIFPYVVMITLLVRAATLPGAAEGMYYFIETDFSKLKEAGVWYAAVSQCFFSLNVGFGNIVTLSSYNSFDHNINRDALIVTTLDTFTSLLSGITIFGILGNLAYEMNISPNEVISAGGGTGLAFISYPNALAKFTFAPWLFAIAFFVMLFVLGIGSLAALHGNVNALIKESFPKSPDWLIAGVSAVCLFLIGLIYITPGGQYALDTVDFFGGTFVIFVFAICETVAIACLYGIENLCIDLEFMMKKKLGIYWRFTWGLIVPLLLTIIFFYFVATLPPFLYGIDNLPLPDGLLAFGWIILGIAAAQMALWIIYYLYVNRKYPGIKVLTKTFSTETWGPVGEKRTEEWKKFREDQKNRRSIKGDAWLIRKLKVLIGK